MDGGLGVRGLLRDLPVLAGASPRFDPTVAPDDPADLFVAWFDQAVAAGVVEPHAMTVSTVDSDGFPDARVLILKDVDAAGWHFAVSTVSRKGVQLAARTAAALTFYWPSLVRQVRVRGTVVADPDDVRRGDFLTRSPGSRASALTRRQSEPLSSPSELDDALNKARRELELDPQLVPEEWVSYAVQARTVEFWQGAPDRRHQRLSYERQDESWSRTVLWP